MMKSIMAATVAVTALLGANAANAMIVNGDFEDTTTLDPTGLVKGNKLSNLATTGSSWDVFSEISGWKTTAGAGIEVQTNRTLGSIDAHSGQHYIELDSHPKPNSNSTMEQEVSLGVGTYELSFWYSPRTNDASSNGIEYSVSDGLLSGFITGPGASPDTSVGVWTLVKSLFKVDTAGDYSLSFAATGKQNTLGGFIDTVNLTAVPIPAAGLLLPVGVAMLGFAARRRKSA
ncbi:MAG: VPLPA-CTERM sorting domain-containing protein [Roseibium album]|uniref:VPLPA-CTERM protein sorting domain-containing protein n=1 Tax=Roseibium album TaxID=311410 RepID=A0A0M6ZV33_9HYPH|nr:VPLPA-CTERM sorting domain-containing protein [Roseibium album]MBG6144148.1 hypothetical protein [Labrenzia sp. EL_142]MBG6157379.1 hypothetical protein [Labrenzia sp. EL_162]MBG6162741.1 hypothetical protein [Labrenzia sp. EL_195]MBG6174795.1 hypothetical protein [Labrenzia sp. EL_132]MBG6196227.1 hypothetical protein [Labrenzia sp. EL_159]MBG6201653.1 hypothetical protein [Labrenzia sp. EL_13]MBG6228923.1 hypothetical protein [Labrenzia sp. EL_208]MCR9056058.1 VPLPA-CTERM sorting domai